MKSVALRLVRDLTPDLAGRRLSSPTITHEGEAAFLAMPPGPPTVKTEHFGLVHPENALDQRYSGAVLICSRDRHTEVPLTGMDFLFPRIQRLPDRQLLLVDIRGWQPELMNAQVYDFEGRLVRSFHLTQTEDVFTDTAGCIWASLDDETDPGPEEGSALVRTDSHGRLQWDFEKHRGKAASVWVFYALNVGREATWACGYTEFEIVRIKEDRVDSWAQQVGWVTEIAIDEPHILTVRGGHRSDPTFSLGRLGPSEVENFEEIRIMLPDGRALGELSSLATQDTPWMPGYTIVGRDDALHVFAEDRWFLLSVQDALR